MISFPGGDTDAFVFPASFSIAALDAASVVLALVLLAKTKSFSINVHVGTSEVSGAIFLFEVLWVRFISFVVENAARSFVLHVEGFASRVLDTHLCAE